MAKAIRFILGSFLLVGFLASLSYAQGVQRTFVSGLGSDGNPCTRTAPCRTFGQAISQTNAGGEVIVLDSAGYGPVTIAKAVSLTSPPGVYAGISVFSGDGIDINASASDTVILRGLTINNQGGNGSGIVFTTGGILHVENCVVNGFSAGNGLHFTGPGNLEVKDSIMRGNLNGVLVENPSASPVTLSTFAFAAIDHVRLEGNTGPGFIARDGALVQVSNSVSSGNQSGFVSQSLIALGVAVHLESCVASNNSSAGITGAGSTNSHFGSVLLSNSTVTLNLGPGLQVLGPGGQIYSRGNNTDIDNAMSDVGTIVSFSAK